MKRETPWIESVSPKTKEIICKLLNKELAEAITKAQLTLDKIRDSQCRAQAENEFNQIKMEIAMIDSDFSNLPI